MQISLTLIIVAITVIAFFLTSRNREAQSKLIFNAYQVVHRKEWWRVFSHALLHADGIHLAVNMFVFWSFGSQLEAVLTNPGVFQSQIAGIRAYPALEGKAIFLMLYIGGIAAGSLPAIFKHKDNPGYNSVGASGAVSAVLLASALLFPTKTWLLYMVIPVKAWIAAILFLVYESYMNKRRRGNVAHDAHLAGAAFGLVFIAIINFQFVSRFFQLVISDLQNMLGL